MRDSADTVSSEAVADDTVTVAADAHGEGTAGSGAHRCCSQGERGGTTAEASGADERTEAMDTSSVADEQSYGMA